MRLSCWPFEVEGQGAAPVPVPPLVMPPPPPPPVPLPPGLPVFQEARYDIRYGALGSVGELSFSVGGVVHAADGFPVVRVSGNGQGAVLGLGGMQRKIETDFDPTTLESRRWTILRTRPGQPETAGTRDHAARNSRGELFLDRTVPGQPPSRQTVAFKVPTFDPLGLLWRLRTAPPPAGHMETMYLLDGPTLWRVRVTTAAMREILSDGNRTAMRLDGDVSPILYDGQTDTGRPTRQFTLWLSDAADHLPLRLEVPVGIADVVMTLIETRALGPVSETRGSQTEPRPALRPGT